MPDARHAAQGYHWDSCRSPCGGAPFTSPLSSSMLIAPACAGAPSAAGSTSTRRRSTSTSTAPRRVNVNASVPALVALRGADLPVDPQARLDRDDVRAFFAGPGAEVTRVSLSRRDGRRFVHVSIDVADVRRLSTAAAVCLVHAIGSTGGTTRSSSSRWSAPPPARTWATWGGRGDEVVGSACTCRARSRSTTRRAASSAATSWGGSSRWPSALTGAPLEMEFQMEPESILYSTLLLFGGTIVAAGAGVRGRDLVGRPERPAGRRNRAACRWRFVVRGSWSDNYQPPTTNYEPHRPKRSQLLELRLRFGRRLQFVLHLEREDLVRDRVARSAGRRCC